MKYIIKKKMTYNFLRKLVIKSYLSPDTENRNQKTEEEIKNDVQSFISIAHSSNYSVSYKG